MLVAGVECGSSLNSCCITFRVFLVRLISYAKMKRRRRRRRKEQKRSSTKRKKMLYIKEPCQNAGPYQYLNFRPARSHRFKQVEQKRNTRRTCLPSSIVSAFFPLGNKIISKVNRSEMDSFTLAKYFWHFYLLNGEEDDVRDLCCVVCKKKNE